MSSMDKRAALVWLIAVASAIGLWVLMTGGPALAGENAGGDLCRGRQLSEPGAQAPDWPTTWKWSWDRGTG